MVLRKVKGEKNMMKTEEDTELLDLTSKLQLREVIILSTVASACIREEHHALLAVKASLSVDSDSLMTLGLPAQSVKHRVASWTGQNCCDWDGVVCSNKTIKHVVKLEIHGFQGSINPALASLSHLEYLYLGGNGYFESIPAFLGSLKNLKHLYMSSAYFLDTYIPPQLGNLSRLTYLHISSDGVYPDASANSLHWLSRLSYLTTLDISGWPLRTSDWLESVSTLPSLRVLKLSNTSLPSIDLNLVPHVNFTYLAEIDLSRNNWSSTFPSWLTKLPTLSIVNLDSCGLYGKIPESLGNLTSLSTLTMFENNLYGEIPGLIRGMCKMKILDLSVNYLSGDIADVGKAMAHCMNQLDFVYLRSNSLTGRLSQWFESFTDVHITTQLSNDSFAAVGIRHSNNSGELSLFRDLDLSYNSLDGILTEEHLANLPMLDYFDLSENPLRITFDMNWVPPFQLHVLGLSSCQLQSQFPHWLLTQTRIVVLDIHDTRCMRTIPNRFWSSFTALKYLDLSKNLFTGQLPTSLVHLRKLHFLALNSNGLEGGIPDMPDSFVVLDLHNNSFSGPLPCKLGGKHYRQEVGNIILSDNRLNGSIPTCFCNMTWLYILDLSNNNLSGHLPDCWNRNSTLRVVDFSNNNLEGEIPSSMGSFSRLRSLHLNNNRLSGMLPSSLQYCKMLILLDVGENNLKGYIPLWIAKSLDSLMILRLRSNQFYGNIPTCLSQLQGLHVLDLGNNKLSGHIPHSLGNFTAMASQNTWQLDPNEFFLLTNYHIYHINLYLMTKGEELTYSTNLYLMKSIDLSDNELTGGVPFEMGVLVELNCFNLSGNNLSGTIPETFGRMLRLESLDLSWNHLSGVIPQTLASLDSLSLLNLSYNNLSRTIPRGSHLQTLGYQDPYIYAGNKYLCTPLATESCSRDNVNPDDLGEGKDGHDIWLYVISGLGFGFGFSAVFWVLVFCKAVGRMYFQYIDLAYERACYRVILLGIKLNAKLVGKK
uniref:non-specific serine/threonine protein kinase n=1 Tax=Leersia perrieri TaxID=77586 RepID=A0A0D9WLL0_9ORYZ